LGSGKVIIITEKNFETEVGQAAGPVLVDFWAAWCGPCKMIAPVLEEIAEDFAGRVKVGKMNVDENSETPGRYGVMSIPTLVLFNKGKEIDRVVGYQPKNQLVKFLTNSLPA